MSQLALSPLKPEMLELDAKVIDAQPSMTKAIGLCQQLAGLDDKELCGAHGVVPNTAQWSRVKSGQHFFPQDKLEFYMDRCRNEAPLIWLARRRGYHLVAMETELERQVRIEREARMKAEEENRLLRELLQGKR